MKARAQPENLEGAFVGGRYRVGALVGESDTTRVYAAEHVQLGSRVALKVWCRARAEASDAEIPDLAFWMEVRSLFAARHPNIVTGLDQGTLDETLGGFPYMVLAWVDGARLSSFLGARGANRVSPKQAWGELRPIADAVAHLHERRIVHGDLAATRILVTRDPSSPGEALQRPVLIDLGSARHLDVPQPARGRYTPSFAAPEHVRGGALEPATDVHGLGLLFLALLARTEPYRGDPRLAAIDPARPSAAELGVDAGPFDGVVTRAVALSERERFVDARAFQRAMDAAAASLEVRAQSSGAALGDQGRAHRWRARRVVWAVGASMLALVVAGATWFALRPSGGALREKVPRASSPSDPLDALDGEAVQARLSARGLRVNLSTEAGGVVSVTALTPGKVSVSLQLVPAPACLVPFAVSCASAVRDALLRSHRPVLAQGQSIAYASGGRRALVVSSASAEEAESALGAVVDGLALGVRGLLRPGDVPTDEGLRASALASLGPGPLTTQLEQAGFEVPWAGSTGEQIQAMAVYRDETGSGTAYVYRGDVTAIVASVVATGEPCAWAESSGYVLVLRGDARLSTRDVLARVIQGLDARVGGSRP